MGMERMNLRKSLALAAVLVNPLLLVSAQTPAAPAPTPVSVVIFSDYECPYSSDLFFNLQRIQGKYDKSLYIIWKQSPLAIHPDAPLAHKAALAAAKQGKFNQMSELL